MPHLATRGRASPQTDKDGLQRAVCPCLDRGWRQVWGSLHPPGVGGGQGPASERSASRPSVYLLGAAVVLPQRLVSPPPGWRPGQHPPLSGTSEALAECGGPQSWVHCTHTRPRDPLLEQGLCKVLNWVFSLQTSSPQAPGRGPVPLRGMAGFPKWRTGALT